MRSRAPLALSLLTTLAVAGSPLVGASSAPSPGAPLTADVVVRPVALTSAVPTPAQQLGARVQAALATSGASTVAAAVDVEGLGAVLREDAAHALPPASTQKSSTALTALSVIPPGTRYTTDVATLATPLAGRLQGSIWIVAHGDPYLSKGQLRGLAQQLRAAGVTYVAGDLVVDDLRYDSVRSVSGWKSSYVPDESGPLSAFAVDRNAYRQDSAFLADPGVQNARLFRSYLSLEGVTVHGVLKRAPRPASAHVVATVSSPPVEWVVRRLMKNSDNFAAELLLKEVGRRRKGTGSSYAGRLAVREVLAARGVSVGSGTDGSGLSRYDRQTPAQELSLLRVAAADPVLAGTFRWTLPIACQDGTLATRMCGTAAAGKVEAKTGTLVGVRVLSGYATTASGRAVVFSFQLLGFSDGTKARAAIDKAAAVLAAAPE